MTTLSRHRIPVKWIHRVFEQHLGIDVHEWGHAGDAKRSDMKKLWSIPLLFLGACPPASAQESAAQVIAVPGYANFAEIDPVDDTGYRRSTKPDILLAGGGQPVRFDPISADLVIASHPNPSRHWGLKVAAPSGDATSGTHFTIGTSGANALATHTAHRIYDAVERAYPQLTATMDHGHKAALIKALLVHCASWRDVEEFIRPIVDPEGSLHHEHWRREVCRHLGYGFVDPEDAIACAGDRATMWATGTLGIEGSTMFNVPVPPALGTSANHREVRATLAWLAPIRPGHLAYRAVKLKINALSGEDLGSFGVSTTTSQPSNSQSESGTIIHRRWRDARIGNFEEDAAIPIHIQREKDQGTPIDDPIPFGLAVTVEMPGAQEIYAQVLQNIALKPQLQIPV